MVLDQTLQLDGKLDTGSADVHVFFVEHITNGETTPPQPLRSNLSGSADVTILPMPTLGQKFREVVYATVYNTHTAAVVCTIKTDNGTTERIVFRKGLGAGESLQYMKGIGWFKEAVV